MEDDPTSKLLLDRFVQRRQEPVLWAGALRPFT